MRALRHLAPLAVVAALVLAQLAHAAAYDPQVEAAQRALTERGYRPGPVDGLMGRRTRAAIRALQKASGLPESGQLDEATRGALGVGAPAAGAAPPAGTAPAPPAAGTPPVVVETRRAPRVLTYRRLGWQPPDTAASVLERSRRATGITDVRNKRGELVVSDPAHVYVLRAGERIDGSSCQPAAGALSIELLLGQGGPVAFRSGNASGYCQLGIGVVLAEGMTLRMAETYWGDTMVPGGRVRVGREGLEYQR